MLTKEDEGRREVSQKMTIAGERRGGDVWKPPPKLIDTIFEQPLIMMSTIMIMNMFMFMMIVI